MYLLASSAVVCLRANGEVAMALTYACIATVSSVIQLGKRGNELTISLSPNQSQISKYFILKWYIHQHVLMHESQ